MQQGDEPRCGRRQMFMPPLDDRQWAMRLESRQLQRLQHSRVDLALGGRQGKNGNAGPDLDRALNVLDVVELVDSIDRHLLLPQRAVQFLADPKILRERDKI